MSDDDVTALPTKRRTHAGTRRQTGTRRRTSTRQRTTTPTERGERTNAHTQNHPSLLVGVIAFLLATATLLYGVTAILDGLRQTTAGSLLAPFLHSSALHTTLRVTRTGTTVALAVASLGVGYVVARSAFAALAGE